MRAKEALRFSASVQKQGVLEANARPGRARPGMVVTDFGISTHSRSETDGEHDGFPHQDARYMQW